MASVNDSDEDGHKPTYTTTKSPSSTCATFRLFRMHRQEHEGLRVTLQMSLYPNEWDSFFGDAFDPCDL